MQKITLKERRKWQCGWVLTAGTITVAWNTLSDSSATSLSTSMATVDPVNVPGINSSNAGK